MDLCVGVGVCVIIDVLQNIMLTEILCGTTRCGLSYLTTQIRPVHPHLGRSMKLSTMLAVRMCLLRWMKGMSWHYYFICTQWTTTHSCVIITIIIYFSNNGFFCDYRCASKHNGNWNSVSGQRVECAWDLADMSCDVKLLRSVDAISSGKWCTVVQNQRQWCIGSEAGEWSIQHKSVCFQKFALVAAGTGLVYCMLFWICAINLPHLTSGDYWWTIEQSGIRSELIWPRQGTFLPQRK